MKWLVIRTYSGIYSFGDITSVWDDETYREQVVLGQHVVSIYNDQRLISRVYGKLVYVADNREDARLMILNLQQISAVHDS